MSLNSVLRRSARRASTPWRLVAAGIVSATLVATTSGPSVAAMSKSNASQPHGPVNVLYAGSLLDLMVQRLGPAFHRATGYSVNGFADGSSALASEIKGGTQVGDVFISASPKVNATLEGASNGNWVTSYEEFGRSPLVLGFSRTSRFADALRTKPWYRVVDRTGFLLGRTDPAVDPKGVLVDEALSEAATKFAAPALRALATSSSNVYPEATLVGRLQSGQLDAGFFYVVEAAAAKLATVPLTGTAMAGEFTVTILKNAPHEAAATAFVQFLLSASGRKILRANGVTPIEPPIVVGRSR